MQEFKEFRNIINSGLTKDSSLIIIILVEISSRPWALLTFKFLMILMTKLLEKGTELILEIVKYTWFSGSLLPLARGVHCLQKKSLKIFTLALKSVKNLLITTRGRITDTLFHYRNLLIWTITFLTGVLDH